MRPSFLMPGRISKNLLPSRLPNSLICIINLLGILVASLIFSRLVCSPRPLRETADLSRRLLVWKNLALLGGKAVFHGASLLSLLAPFAMPPAVEATRIQELLWRVFVKQHAV